MIQLEKEKILQSFNYLSKEENAVTSWEDGQKLLTLSSNFSWSLVSLTKQIAVEKLRGFGSRISLSARTESLTKSFIVARHVLTSFVAFLKALKR